MNNENIHNSSNCWKTKDGEFIPMEEMTSTHLRNAKNWAQRMEEYYFRKYTEFSMKVAMIDEEADRRGITIRDRSSKYHQNTARIKNGFETTKDSSDKI